MLDAGRRGTGVGAGAGAGGYRWEGGGRGGSAHPRNSDGSPCSCDAQTPTRGVTVVHELTSAS